MIYHIKTSDKEIAKTLTEALRTAQIAAGKGALIVQPVGKDHPVEGQIEKIIDGVAFDPERKLKETPWKKDAAVIVSDLKDLKAFDEAAPGFSKHFGPIKTITVG